MDLEAALADAKEALDHAEYERDEVTQRITQLRVEVEGLQFAIARQRNAGSAPVSLLRPPVSDEAVWPKFSRIEAVEKVLQESGERVLSPGDITVILRGRGRDDDANDVSASLAYLKRQNRVMNLGRAQWTIRRPILAGFGSTAP